MISLRICQLGPPTRVASEELGPIEVPGRISPGPGWAVMDSPPKGGLETARPGWAVNSPPPGGLFTAHPGWAVEQPTRRSPPVTWVARTGLRA
jgi:hypothetical protein